MYKRFCIFALMALVIVSCSKQEMMKDVDVQFNAAVRAEMTVLVKSGETQAEPVIANHAVLQAWQGDKMVAKAEQSIDPGTTQISFSGIKLAAGAEYLVYIWVDCDGYYNTTDLRSVSVSVSSEKAYDGKSEEFDAFYSCSAFICGQNDEVHQVTLTRPFAKVNFSAQVASQLEVKFTAPTTFNLKTGEVSGKRSVGYKINPTSESVKAFDYIFATEDVSHLSYTFKLGTEDEKTTSVPVKRNTKTNIIYSVTN